jgi:hypothetical protein
MLETTKNLVDMAVSIDEFDKINFADYANLPVVAANYVIVRTATAAINVQSALQMSGEKSRSVQQKSVLRGSVRRKMKDLSRTARAINIHDAGFQSLFRLPNSNSDQTLIAAAREFIAKATEHKAAFFDLGIPESLISDLESDTNDLEQAISSKSAAQTKTVGATAEIDKQISLLMEAVTIIDAAMHNVYRDNPTKLAAWASARHIKRTKRQPKTPQTPPPVH